MNAPRSPSAFTLIEVLVATTIMAVTLAAAVSVFTFAVTVQSEGLARNQVARDAQLVVDVLASDIAAAGVGVPRGFRGDVPDFTGGTRESHQLRPVVRRFKPDHLVLVGDLPYPNADLNGMVTIANIKLGDDHRTFVTSELSGCVPPASSPGDYVCDTSVASHLGPFPAADLCDSGNPGRRTCPWGLNKWQTRGANPVRLIYGGIDGSWYEREWDMTGTADDGPYFGMHIEHTSPNANTYTGSAKDLPQASFFAGGAGGFISQVDRVFWSFEAPGAPGTACATTTPPFCVLRRRQCFGAVTDPAAANFPVVDDAAFRANLTPTDCSVPNDGTDWETIATGVRSFVLRTFDAAGTELTGAWTPTQASLAASIEVEVVMEAKVKGTTRTVSHRTKKRTLIINRGGIDNAAVVDGGCDDTLDPLGCLGEN